MARAPLSQLADFKLVDERQDVRGWTVQDESGLPLGIVRYLIVDMEREEVDSIALEDGEEIPVESIEIRDGFVVAHSQHAGVTPGDRFRMKCMRRKVA